MPDRLQTDQPTLKEAEQDVRLVEAANAGGDADDSDLTGDADDSRAASRRLRRDAPASESKTNLGTTPSELTIKPTIPPNPPKISKSGKRGIVRHRLIISACFAFSAFLLALSLADVKSLVQYEARVDSGMNVQPLPSVLTHDNSLYVDRVGSEGLHRVEQFTQHGWKHGFVNDKGEFVIPLQFESAGSFSEGLAQVRPDDERLMGYIDRTGKLVIAARFQAAQPFHSGVAPVRLADGNDWAFIDRSGKVLRTVRSQPRYIDGTNAWVAANVPDSDGGSSDYGVIDSHGNWLIRPEYSHVRVGRGRHYWFHDLNDSGYKSPEREHASYLQIENHNRLWGIADLHGKILAEPRFTEILGYNDGFVTFRSNKKCGISSLDGKTLVPAVHDEVTTFGDVIGVKDGGKWSFLGRDGKPLSDLTAKGLIKEMVSETWFVNGLGPVLIGDKCGFVGANGRLAIPAEFDFAMPFHDGYAAVVKDGVWRYIDIHGNIMPPKFTLVTAFDKNGIVVSTPGPLYAFAKGQEVQRMRTAVSNMKNHFSKTLFEPEHYEE